MSAFRRQCPLEGRAWCFCILRYRQKSSKQLVDAELLRILKAQDERWLVTVFTASRAAMLD